MNDKEYVDVTNDETMWTTSFVRNVTLRELRGLCLLRAWCSWLKPSPIVCTVLVLSAMLMDVTVAERIARTVKIVICDKTTWMRWKM